MFESKPGGGAEVDLGGASNLPKGLKFILLAYLTPELKAIKKRLQYF